MGTWDHSGTSGDCNGVMLQGFANLHVSFAVELDRPLAAGVAQCMTLASIVPSQMSGEGGESCVGVEVWMLRAE